MTTAVRGERDMTDGRLSSGQVGRLCDLLGAEDRHYRRLLRLAWRQNRYLRRQDIGRLEFNAGQWRQFLPEARAARRERESYMGDLATGLGVAKEEITPQYLLDRADHENGERLRAVVIRVARAAADLDRQCELNRRLSRFCLELAQEEARIFREAVLEDPSGCYDGVAERTQAPPGGLFIRQA
jgi:hypothetical protein